MTNIFRSFYLQDGGNESIGIDTVQNNVTDTLRIVTGLTLGLSVCLSVHERVSATARPNFTKLSVHVKSGRGSALLWRRSHCYYTSGFVVDVTFSLPITGPMKTCRYRCKASKTHDIFLQA